MVMETMPPKENALKNLLRILGFKEKE